MQPQRESSAAIHTLHVVGSGDGEEPCETRNEGSPRQNDGGEEGEKPVTRRESHRRSPLTDAGIMAAGGPAIPAGGPAIPAGWRSYLATTCIVTGMLVPFALITDNW